MYDTGDRRGWLVDGASALLHITRTQLSTSPYSDSTLFKLEDFNHANPYDPEIGVHSASKALLDLENRRMVIFEDEISSELATGQTRKVKPWKYEDLVRQTYHTLEQIHDYQTKMMTSPSLGIRFTDRDKLIGFGFRDIVEGHNDLLPRVATLKSSGRGWVDFTRSIRAISLLVKGFGEILRPSKDSNKTCKYWKQVPRGHEYLAACTTTLKEISRKHGDSESDPLELANGIYWHKPHKLFEVCDCKQFGSKKGCERVQVHLPSLFVGSKNHPQPFDCQNGAVIFGRSRRFPWRWPSKGEPVEGRMSDSESDDEDNFRDSGVGESLPSTSELGSSPKSNSTPSDDSQSISATTINEDGRSCDPDLSFSNRSYQALGGATMSGALDADDAVPSIPQIPALDHVVSDLPRTGLDVGGSDVPGAVQPTPKILHQVPTRPVAKRAWDELKDSALQMFPRKKQRASSMGIELETNTSSSTSSK